MHRHALLFVATLSLSACAGEISTFDPDTEGGTSEGGSGGGTEGGTSGPGTSGNTGGTSTSTSTSSGGSTSGGSTGGAATSTSSGGSTSGGSTGGTTGGEKEKVYYECETNADCPPDAPWCFDTGDSNPIRNFCTASCFYSYECAAPTTGDQVAVCKADLQNEAGIYFCFPSCANGFECPVGMECFADLIINNNPNSLVHDVCGFPNN